MVKIWDECIKMGENSSLKQSNKKIMKIFEKNETIDLNKQIDKWVLERINQGVLDFYSLSSSLPGIYPNEILNSLKRMVLLKVINSQTVLKIVKDAGKNPENSSSYGEIDQISPPHPLDYEWRFTKETVINLAKYCLSHSNPGDSICLLGVPSLYRLVTNNKLKRNFILFDKNPIEQKTVIGYCASISCDLLCDHTAGCELKAKIVLMDSPWYPEYTRAFLWNASKICEIEGLLLMVTPKEGTRPNIKQEWRSTLRYSKRIGFSYLGKCPVSVRYDTPFFERNALKSVGILNFPQNWRCADLTAFVKIEDTNTLQPLISSSTDWYKESYMGIKVRKYSISKEFTNPKLVSIIPGDILPSVSRRDGRREKADVWTYGNRIFQCNGTNVLQQILSAMNTGKSPYINVESLIGRKMNKEERNLISITRQQIDNLIKVERAELWNQ